MWYVEGSLRLQGLQRGTAASSVLSQKPLSGPVGARGCLRGAGGSYAPKPSFLTLPSTCCHLAVRVSKASPCSAQAKAEVGRSPRAAARSAHPASWQQVARETPVKHTPGTRPSPTGQAGMGRSAPGMGGSLEGGGTWEVELKEHRQGSSITCLTRVQCKRPSV